MEGAQDKTIKVHMNWGLGLHIEDGMQLLGGADPHQPYRQQAPRRKTLVLVRGGCLPSTWSFEAPPGARSAHHRQPNAYSPQSIAHCPAHGSVPTAQCPPPMRGPGVRLGISEGWKPQKVGGCRWSRRPQNRVGATWPKIQSILGVGLSPQFLGLSEAFRGRFLNMLWS